MESKGHKKRWRISRQSTYPTKMQGIDWALNFYEKYGYICLSKPFKWNRSKFEMDIVTSRYYYWVWYCNVACVILSTSSQVLSLAFQISYGTLKFNEIVTIVRLVTT